MTTQLSRLTGREIATGAMHLGQLLLSSTTAPELRSRVLAPAPAVQEFRHPWLTLSLSDGEPQPEGAWRSRVKPLLIFKQYYIDNYIITYDIIILCHYDAPWRVS